MVFHLNFLARECKRRGIFHRVFEQRAGKTGEESKILGLLYAGEIYTEIGERC